MTDITVACVLVKGHVNYSPEYVVRLRSVVRKFLQRPHRFAVLTDQPKSMPKDMLVIPIRKPDRLKGWWSKIELFNPEHPLSGRVLYLDLDTLPVAPLEPILDFDARFALVPHAGKFEGKDGLRVIKRFNSSVMSWNAGDLVDLYLDWHPMVARELWGDQDWIGLKVPVCDPAFQTMPLEWFPRISEVGLARERKPWPEAAKVILCKRPKNHEAAEMYPWFNREWQ